MAWCGENLEGIRDRAATRYLHMAISGRCELDSAHCAYLLVPTSRVLDAFCQVVVSADTRIRRTVLYCYGLWHPLKLLDPNVCLVGVFIKDASDVSSALDLIQSVRLFA